MHKISCRVLYDLRWTFDSYSFCNFIFSFEFRPFRSIGVGTSYSGSEVPTGLISAKNFSSFAGSPIHPLPSRHHQDPFKNLDRYVTSKKRINCGLLLLTVVIIYLNCFSLKTFYLCFVVDRYYISQQLTEKSDIYSFGVILLELISGHEPISNDNFGLNCRNIVAWVRREP